jgi:hypothetical protein
MDAMALLCNMHADGPATIKLLRRAGLSSLPDVTRARPERLADLLGVSPAYARRFAREARLLGERMGENVLDIEECVDIETGDSAPEPASFDRPPSPASPPRISSGSPSSARSIATSSIDTISGDASSIYARSMDTTSMSTERRDAARARSAGWLEDDVAPAESYETPSWARARVLPATGSALRAGLIEGLDAVWCDRLVAQGVLTLETLVDSPGMKLAKRLGVPLTELMDLQILAQRKLAESSGARGRASSEPPGEPRRAPVPATPEYVLFPRSRHVSEIGDELGARESVAFEESDDGASAPGTVHIATSDEAEDVGGPFA